MNGGSIEECRRVNARVLPVLVLAIVLAAGGLMGPLAAQETTADSTLVEAALRVLDQQYVQPVDAPSLLNIAIAALREQTHLGPDTLPDVAAGLSEAEAIALFHSEFTRAVALGALPAGDLATEALREMLASLHDSHVYYLNPSQYSERLKELMNEPVHVGMGFVPILRRDGAGTLRVFVGAVFPGSPAAAAGLRKFDEITQIDGRQLSTSTEEEREQLVHGPDGSTVSLTVRRSGQVFTVQVTRGAVRIRISPVTVQMIRPGVLYARIFGFFEGTADQFRAAVLSVRAEHPILAIILDLRGNRGGLLEEAASVAGIFLPAYTPLAHNIPRSGTTRFFSTGKDPLLPSGTLVALVDGGTGSASEIVTAGLQDAHRATIVGEKTAGSLGEARLVTLPSGGGMSVTVAQIVGSQGRRIDGIGIMPDTIVPLTTTEIEAGVDSQLEAALKIAGAKIRVNTNFRAR